MTDKELLQQALDTLDTFSDENGWGEKQKKAYEAIKARLAQPDAEAVAWVDEITLRDLKNGKEGVHLVYEVEMVNASIPLFEYPPKKEWVGLTKEEARKICVATVPYVVDMAAAIEAKLKEKNTLAQPEPEELGEIIPADEEQLKRIANLVKPEKEWVSLTDKEVVILAYQSQENECTAIRLAEQALKEKNT